MSNLKKWIIMLIIILIIILAALIYTVYKNRGTILYGIDEQGSEITYELDKSIQQVSVRNNYYIVKNCVNKFYTYYMSIFDINNNYYEEDQSTTQEAQKQNTEVIYNMLAKEYINSRNITKDNMLTKLEKINNSIVNVTNIYVSEQTDNIYVYIVQGTLRENTTQQISNFKIMVEVDSLNRTFAVFLQDYINEKYKDLQVGDNIDIGVPTNIQKNENNVYTFKAISDETYAKDLFNQYKETILYNPELLYNNLDKEYKEKRFGTLEKFQIYTKDNKKYIEKNRIDKYKKTAKDDYTQYVCIDQNGNYYIFKETAVMQYSLILDTYTVDLPEFVEKYNNSAENEKVMLNIQRVLEALNSRDYKYVYDKLDNTFKTNYFKTQANFEEYIKKNFYTQNKITYGDYQKNGDVYIYNIQIIDLNNNNSVAKSKKIVMQLKEGTDFVMSFNVE